MKHVVNGQLNGLYPIVREGTTVGCRECRAVSMTEDSITWEQDDVLIVWSKQDSQAAPQPSKDALVPGVFSGKKRVNPSTLRFCQDSIPKRFRDGRLLTDTLRELQAGTVGVDDIPKISVFEMDGHFYSTDNRRLWVFQQFGERITVKLEDLSQVDPRRFRILNGGIDVHMW